MLDVGYILPVMTITASEMGRRGMRSRLAKMSPEERRDLARKAAQARWARTSPEERSAFGKKIRGAAKSRLTRKAKAKRKAR